MKIENVKLSDIKLNPNNPRLIKDDKFKKLVQSIIDFPEMLKIRPIVVNEDMIILGGNMRFKACKEAGLKEVPIIKTSGLSEQKQKEFLIKDNIAGGEWDWNLLANEWDEIKLTEWGLDVWKSSSDINLDDFFADNGDSEKDQKFKIILEYTQTDYDAILDAFAKHSGSKENIIAKLLGV
jgi:hypothetical protein